MIRKDGRVLSQENADHLRSLMEHLDKMAECGVKGARLHDALHQTLEEMAQHGTSAGEHLRAVLGAAGIAPDNEELSFRPMGRPGESDAHFVARMRAWFERPISRGRH